MRDFILNFMLFVFCGLLVQNSYSQDNDEYYKMHLSHVLNVVGFLSVICLLNLVLKKCN